MFFSAVASPCQVSAHILGVSRMNMYTAEKWDVLGCAFPTTKRLPEAREISRGTGDFHRSTGNLKVGGRYNLIHLNSRKCTVILSLLIHPWGCIRKYIRVGQSALTVLKVLILTLSIQIAPLGRISCMRQAAFNRLCDNRPRWNTFLQENLIYIYLLL